MARPVFDQEQLTEYAARVKQEYLRNKQGGPMYSLLRMNYGKEVADNNASQHLSAYTKACKSAKLPLDV